MGKRLLQTLFSLLHPSTAFTPRPIVRLRPQLSIHLYRSKPRSSFRCSVTTGFLTIPLRLKLFLYQNGITGQATTVTAGPAKRSMHTYQLLAPSPLPSNVFRRNCIAIIAARSECICSRKYTCGPDMHADRRVRAWLSFSVTSAFLRWVKSSIQMSYHKCFAWSLFIKDDRLRLC